MNPPLTMREVARHLGVSTMMVSRALNNRPDISPEKRNWILGEVNRLGYQIHPYVRCTMSARRMQQSTPRQVPIALLNLWNPSTEITQPPAYRTMLNGCMARARELGYRIDAFSPREAGITMARLDRILQSRGICGILVPPLPTSHGHLRLDWNRYTAIAMGFTLRYPDLNRVTCNLALAMQTIIHQLKNTAVKRIGFITTASSEKRLNSHHTGSFLSWQNQMTTITRLPICRVRRGEANILKRWVLRHRPDVVVLQFAAMLEWIHEAGFSIPGDFRAAVLDLYEEDTKIHGIDFSGTRLGNDLLGQKAVEMLISQIERHDQGVPARPTVLMVPPLWHAGATV